MPPGVPDPSAADADHAPATHPSPAEAERTEVDVPSHAPPTGATPARVLVEPGGPLLLEGPVEVALPDGTTARSDRCRVALCTCRRSRRYPWCDTSHRRKRQPPGGARGDRG